MTVGKTRTARVSISRQSRLISNARLWPMSKGQFWTSETITLFGNNVGIGGTCAGSVRLLRKLHTICAQGGRLILTGLDVRKTENPVHLEYHAANLAKGRRRGEITIRLAYDGEADAPFDWFHPEPYEVEEIAAQSGWTITRLEPRGAFFWAVLKRD